MDKKEVDLIKRKILLYMILSEEESIFKKYLPIYYNISNNIDKNFFVILLFIYYILIKYNYNRPLDDNIYDDILEKIQIILYESLNKLLSVKK